MSRRQARAAPSVSVDCDVTWLVLHMKHHVDSPETRLACLLALFIPAAYAAYLPRVNEAIKVTFNSLLVLRYFSYLLNKTCIRKKMVVETKMCSNKTR